MILNAAALSSLFTSLKTTFHNALKTAAPTWEKIAMRVPSTTKQNDYVWLSNWPAMRKWIGEKTVKKLRAGKYVAVNEDFESTIEVDRNDIEDDNLGIYGPQAQMAGQSASELPDQLIYELVNGGFTNTCYDGQYFFDTDHPVGEDAASVSNKLTAALSFATLAAANASLGAAITKLRSMKDDEGRPMNLRPTVLLVPPALESVANALMTVDRLEDGKPNPYKGKMEVVVSGCLTNDAAWFVLDTSKPIRPFIFQERKKPVFVSQTRMDSDTVFHRKTFLYGVEARGTGVYGLWQLAVGSTGAG